MIVTVMLGACSYTTTRPPRWGASECDSSRAPAVIDLVAAAGAPFGVYWLLSYDDHASDPIDAHDQRIVHGAVTMLVSVPLVAVEIASAAYGFRNARRCEEYLRDHPQAQQITGR